MHHSVETEARHQQQLDRVRGTSELSLNVYVPASPFYWPKLCYCSLIANPKSECPLYTGLLHDQDWTICRFKLMAYILELPRSTDHHLFNCGQLHATQVARLLYLEMSATHHPRVLLLLLVASFSNFSFIPTYLFSDIYIEHKLFLYFVLHGSCNWK